MPRHHDTGLPRDVADEKSVLTGFLGHLRGAVVAKAVGVPDPAAREPGVPSGTSLLGLVSHLTHVERHYFLGEAVRDWPATFRPREEDTAEDVVAAYREATTRADAVIATWSDLDRAAPVPAGRRSAPSRRWLLAHMIEETGRHAGHADILRERIDGRTGR